MLNRFIESQLPSSHCQFAVTCCNVFVLCAQLGETPLHFACKFGFVETVAVLISNPGTDRQLKNTAGLVSKDVCYLFCLLLCHIISISCILFAVSVFLLLCQYCTLSVVQLFMASSHLFYNPLFAIYMGLLSFAQCCSCIVMYSSCILVTW